MSKKIIYGVLIVLVLTSRLLLVSKYPGDEDPALYIVSMSQLVNPPAHAAPSIFNQEMSFGYYFLLSFIDRMIGHNTALLITIMNYLNAILGVLIIFVFGLLAKRLAKDTVAIFGMLILLLDHSIWNWSLYGHPSVVSIAFFMLSIYFFDKAITETKNNSQGSLEEGTNWKYLLCSGLFGLVSLLIRVDIIFISATYILLYQYRDKGKRGYKELLLFYTLTTFTYLTLKFWALGYIIAPGAGTVPKHIHNLFKLEKIAFSIITNLGLFAAGMGVLFTAAAIGSMFYWGKKHLNLLIILIITVCPVFILVFFDKMDFARISLPVHPLLALFVAFAFEKTFSATKKPIVWGIGGIVIAYILQTAVVYYPLKKVWSHKFPLQVSGPLVVRPVPIGWFVSDRKNRWEDENRLYQQAVFISKQKGNLLIICNRLHYWRMVALLIQLCPNAILSGERDGTVPRTVPQLNLTPSADFYSTHSMV